MNQKFLRHLDQEIDALRSAGLYKTERIITSRQSAKVEISTGTSVLNFCSNNYLGLADHPELIRAAKFALDRYGYGMASVRFICGTQEEHKTLEEKIAKFLGTEDAILYSSCFDANAGLFETLLDENDAIISDALNHASIIDGVRLSKARRYRYANNDMHDLESKLQESVDSRFRLIVTDGVFSMDGIIANLKGVCSLANKYDAMVMVDDSHSTGFIGDTGRGTHEHCKVLDRVDIITSTLGKALGGAMGGFTSGKKEIIEMLRQRSRPYLFSNSLAPPIVGAASAVFDLLSETTELRDQLMENMRYFRQKITEAGFDIKPGESPIVPIMLYDARKAQDFANALLEEGIYVIGFFYPVVAKGQARIRVQLSAAHTKEHLEHAISSFTRIGRRLHLLG